MDASKEKFSTRITLMITDDMYLDLKALAIIKMVNGFSTIIRFGLQKYLTTLKAEMSDEDKEVFSKVRANFDLTNKLEQQLEEE